ncbi:PAS domain S-box protein [Oxalobacteraceae bacterium R-40]|uniref:histidine kinase n=1 Tax=Keguizhuia sedimenti TaxID=3064264 RepID=A0ABU1BJD5_9BURK|nr:PAS domain S-box protein [Oxalobacteraceae bacterium R-40]
MQTSENHNSEVERLRQTTRDLIAISTLPAVWGGLQSEDVIKSLAGVLLKTLNLDLVYIRLAGNSGSDPIEAICIGHHGAAESFQPAVCAMVDSLLAQPDTTQPATVPDPFGDGILRVSLMRFGIAQENGIVVTGSRRADFPSEHDRLILGVGTNQAAVVVERQRTEQALQKSEKRFLDVGDTAPAMLWVTEPDGYCTFLARGWYEFTGQNENEGLGFGWIDAVHPEDRDRVRKAFLDANEQKNEFLCEHRVLHADGNYRWVIDAGRPRLSPSGEFLGIVGNVLDITQRKQTEEALREAQTLLSTVFEILPVGVGVVNADGTIVHSNQEMHRYLPTKVMPSRDDARHKRWRANHADGRPIDRDQFPGARALRGEQVVPGIEMLHTQDDGKEIWTQVAAVPIRNGSKQITGQVSVVTNIDAFKRTEDALSRSEEKYRSLFNEMDEGFCIVQVIFNDNGAPVDYRFIETNPMFEHQTGIKSATGKTARELQPDIEAFWIETYGRIALTGQAQRFVDHSPSMGRWFDVNAFRLGLPEKRQVAILFRDITERKRIEQELHESGRRKDEFLAMLAHELRNPLAPIGAGAELLQLVELDDTQVRKTSEIISRQVSHMTNLIDDLLDVSRVTRGLVELDNVPLEIRHVIADAVEQVNPLIYSKRHHLTLHLPPDSTMVFGDAKRLVQIVANLLNNAAKYTPEGGNIALKTEVQDAHVLLEVMDNGIGMAPELVDRVFDLFSQAERTSDRSSGGLGLGLALVKSLGELHGGTVTASSAGIGKGSRFVVSLPRLLQPVKKTGEAPAGINLHSASRPLKILAVDDNLDAAALLSMVLEAAGHHVLVEHGAVRAMERARIEVPDVCILDIGLPEIDGNALAQRLRAQPETAKSVLIAVTGYGREDDRKAAIAAGFDHHLVKPVDIKKLTSILAGIGVLQ